MAWLVPAFIQGAAHTAALMRRAAQRPASSESGIAEPGDLKVTALPSAGRGFRIAQGSLSLKSGFAGRSRESYGVENGDSVIDWLGPDGAGINGTGSSARSDAVVIEVLDPNYLSITHEDAELTNYMRIHVVEGVGSTITRIGQVPGFSNRTAYLLARIDWPAGQTAVQNSYIKDMRALANPKTEEQVISYSLVGGDEEVLTATGANGEVWPNAFTNSTERAVIPDWATQVDVFVTWIGVECLSAAAVSAVWCQIAGATGDPGTGPNIVTQRTTLRGSAMFAVSDRKSVPAALRGTTQRIYGMARLVGSVTGNNRPKLDAHSSMQIRLVWRQVAV